MEMGRSTINTREWLKSEGGKLKKGGQWWTGSHVLAVMDTIKLGGGGGIPDVALLLLGEFQSVAEDLDSRLFITESTCLGRLTVDTEHLPKKPRERHTDVHTGHMVERKNGNLCGVMRYARRVMLQTYARTLTNNMNNPHWCQVLCADCI